MSNPGRPEGATARERVFAAHYVDTGGNMVYAAEKAGWKAPESNGRRALARPAVIAEIQKRQNERMNNELLPAAVDLLHKVLTDDKENTRNRIAAAKIVIDRTLGATDGANAAKELHEMTAEEIAAQLDQLRNMQREKAEGARDVTPDQIEGGDLEPGAFG